MTLPAHDWPILNVQAGQGQQLMLEGVAIVGALLLAMDRCLPGAARERALVMHVRISGGAAAVGPGLNSVMALAAASGFRPGKRVPEGEPRSLCSAASNWASKTAGRKIQSCMPYLAVQPSHKVA